MEEKNYTGIVPGQESGFTIDTSSDAELDDLSSAQQLFQKAKERLLDVNNWHSLSGAPPANVRLVDASGTELNRNAEKGDYIRIDVPGPGTDSGKGFDWVQIEEMGSSNDKDVESCGFRVRPARRPGGSDDDVSHFYSPSATSTFTVTREANKITAAIYDRNTKVNTTADSATEKIRDAVVGTGGILAFSKIQWKKLTDGLVAKNKQ